MRYLMLLLAAAATALSTTPAHADQLFKLVPDDGAAGTEFGWSVAISGDTAVIGSYKDDDLGMASGSAYVYVRDANVWTLQAKLLASDGTEFRYFGWSVAISGDTAVIGMPYDNVYGDISGSAYVFVRDGGTWTQQAKLLAGDGAILDTFGLSVSIDGDTAVVGAYGDDDNGDESGSAYVFVRNGGVWTQQAKLLASDGAENDEFGWSVSNNGDTAIVGSYMDDDNGSASGSAYVFVRDGVSWSQQAKLLPDDGNNGDYFGHSVSASGDTTVIGAHKAEYNDSMTGAAYIFTRDADVWTQQAKLVADDSAWGDYFGFAVSISGDTTVIGAYQDDDIGTSSGSAYAFARNAGVWTQQAKLLPSDGAADDRFGRAVATSDGTAVVGAMGDDDNGSFSGSAYLFDVGVAPCPGDLDGDGDTDQSDLGILLASYLIDDGGDLDGDGDTDQSDLGILLADYECGT